MALALGNFILSNHAAAGWVAGTMATGINKKLRRRKEYQQSKMAEDVRMGVVQPANYPPRFKPVGKTFHGMPDPPKDPHFPHITDRQMKRLAVADRYGFERNIRTHREGGARNMYLFNSSMWHLVDPQAVDNFYRWRHDYSRYYDESASIPVVDASALNRQRIQKLGDYSRISKSNLLITGKT